MFMSVDLPEPEGPTIATLSPASIARSTWLNATKMPSPEGYSRRTPLSSMSGMGVSSVSSQRAARILIHRRVGSPDHHPFPGFEPRQDLRVHMVVDSDADLALRLPPLGIHHHHARRRRSGGNGSQRRRRHCKRLPGLIEYDVDLHGHGDAQFPIVVTHIEQAVIVNR